MGLIDEIRRVGVAQTLDKLERLDPAAHQQVAAALIQELQQECQKDGLLWLRNVQTRDEADPDQPIKPFPVHLEYIRHLWDLLGTHHRLVIAKSRQMLVSWLVVGFCVWWARYRPHQAVYWQSQQWKDACGMVARSDGQPLGRAHLIERYLPGWLQQPIKTQDGLISYPNGSFIEAVAGGADQIRGKVGSIVVLDEFAKQVEAAGVWATIAPIAHEKVRVVIIGTPNGTDNTFCTLWHGRPVRLGER